MTPLDLLNTLISLGITVRVQEDNLVLMPRSKIPPDLIPKIRGHKADLLSLVLGAKSRRGQSSGSFSVSDSKSLLGRDVAVGFYKQGKGPPKIPLNGRGTTVLEASGLCSPSCAHEFGARESEEMADDNRH